MKSKFTDQDYAIYFSAEGDSTLLPMTHPQFGRLTEGKTLKRLFRAESWDEAYEFLERYLEFHDAHPDKDERPRHLVSAPSYLPPTHEEVMVSLGRYFPRKGTYSLSDAALKRAVAWYKGRTGRPSDVATMIIRNARTQWLQWHENPDGD